MSKKTISRILSWAIICLSRKLLYGIKRATFALHFARAKPRKTCTLFIGVYPELVKGFALALRQDLAVSPLRLPSRLIHCWMLGFFRSPASLLAPLRSLWQGVTLTRGSASTAESVRTFLPPSMLSHNFGRAITLSSWTYL